MISTKTIFLLLRENLQDKFIIFILRRVSHGRGLGLGGGHKEGGGGCFEGKKSQFWKKQNGIQRSSLLGRGCDVCWSCVSASNEFPNLDIMKSHLSVSAGVTILMMTLGRDQLHIRGISFVPVLMLAGADRKLWPWHERQAHPATCYTPRTKERAKVVTNGGLFVKAHTPTRVVQAALRAETSWARIRVNTTWKRFKGTSEAIPESVAEMQSVL